MQHSKINNFSIICLLFVFVIIQAGLRPANSLAGENLLLLYSNDVRSDLEACG